MLLRYGGRQQEETNESKSCLHNARNARTVLTLTVEIRSAGQLVLKQCYNNWLFNTST